MPWLGLGLFNVKPGREAQQVIRYALEAGYRSFDTAAYYNNERDLGQTLHESGIAREQVFITTKVWTTDMGYNKTIAAFNKSLQLLQTDYIDLYLIHWPASSLNIRTWRALEEIYKKGNVRAIGVSNFSLRHMGQLWEYCEISPMVNQYEFHPFLQQPVLTQCCLQFNIQVEAWSPLMRGQALSHPVIVAISQRYDKTPAQIILRWEIQRRIVVIPKSVHRERILENSRIFDFELSENDIMAINDLDTDRRIGPNPHELEL
jgi:diketogulonate reductase-like aldo/keto reductase